MLSTAERLSRVRLASRIYTSWWYILVYTTGTSASLRGPGLSLGVQGGMPAVSQQQQYEPDYNSFQTANRSQHYSGMGTQSLYGQPGHNGVATLPPAQPQQLGRLMRKGSGAASTAFFPQRSYSGDIRSGLSWRLYPCSPLRLSVPKKSCTYNKPVLQQRRTIRCNCCAGTLNDHSPTASRARETLQQMGVPDDFAPVRLERQEAAFDFVGVCPSHPQCPPPFIMQLTWLTEVLDMIAFCRLYLTN